jgi:hypothetical protein
MQYIDDYIVTRYSPIELVTYFKENNLDFNKPVNITVGRKNYGDIFFCILHAIEHKRSHLFEYYKAFIEAGADINIKGEDYMENLFNDIIESRNEQLLELCLPLFKLKSNTYIMFNVYIILSNKQSYSKKYINLIYKLISKFNQKKWKKKLAIFKTDPQYNTIY